MSSIHSVDSSSSTSSVIEPTTPVGEDYWTVMVTHVISPNEVYLRVESTSSVSRPISHTCAITSQIR